MTYGTIKVDTVTFTDAGIDKSVTLSGLVQNPTFSGNVTVTGTLSGVTVTGTTANFTSGNFTNISGGTHTITSGVFAAGSAASPSITFTGDLNTGIYSPGADQVAISTNGTGRLFVDASGNVTLAGQTIRYAYSTSNTGELFPTLSFYNTTTSTELASIVSGTGSAVNNGVITFNVASAGTNSERMRLDSSGRLGLGTSTPGANLDARGTVALGSLLNIDATSGTPITASWAATSAGGRMLSLSNTAAGSSVGQGNSLYQATFSNDQGNYGRAYQVTTNSADKFWVGSNGSAYFGSSVGIGTTPAAGSLLHINSAASTDCKQQISVTTGTQAAYTAYVNTTVSVVGTENSTGGSLMSGSGPYATVISNTGVYPINFGTNNTIRATIDSSGRLLVGTSSASVDTRFQITQSIDTHWCANLEHTGGSSTPLGLRIKYNSSPNNAGAVFLSAADSTATRAEIRSNGGIANYSSNNVNLSDRNAKKDIAPAAGTWDCLKEWEIVNFRYKDQPDDAVLNMGVIAQQVAESCPEVITVFQEATEDQPEKLGVKDQQMMWMAIKALQEAQLRIETLEAKVATLEAV